MANPGGSTHGRFAPPTPPLKGSFPLDHQQECHLEMINYMYCLKKTGYYNSDCRDPAKEYFRCRMERGLMDKSEWSKLGYEPDEPKEIKTESKSVEDSPATRVHAQ
ncbi:cytochrome c oxidase assembly protein COX19 [Ditylenchus destructor]|uniref:Cytochrome c oxidase assembly protein COX19 n=1 Tax=Ditylenchus destructor TaxID=166010 RepID=A0AAD4R0J6_9BILA|nr:cytochrome c oxidase assembly protein COX19 [Ditylenchus destructor]